MSASAVGRAKTEVRCASPARSAAARGTLDQPQANRKTLPRGRTLGAAKEATQTEQPSARCVGPAGADQPALVHGFCG